MDFDVIISCEDDDSWTERVSTDGLISVGRHFQCTLCLDSDLISRQHAIIHPLADGLRVEDVSTNGTHAGGQTLHRTSIDVPFGAPIVVGEYTLRVQPAAQAR